MARYKLISYSDDAMTLTDFGSDKQWTQLFMKELKS